MPVDHIRYDLLTQDALRDMIRRVLVDAAAKGLPGDHHFLITFDTRAEGVRISARLRASYPQDMTIVLQHQFWDLAVGDDDFEVGLAFNGIPERLYVPLKAVKGFFDPSVQFGLPVYRGRGACRGLGRHRERRRGKCQGGRQSADGAACRHQGRRGRQTAETRPGTGRGGEAAGRNPGGQGAE